MSNPKAGKTFNLYGYPISHSAAPALHNAIFDSLGEGKRYGLYSTSKITQDVLDSIRSDESGGCAYVPSISFTSITVADNSAIVSQCQTKQQ